ncbi:hypothetical protein EVAR_83522_1 [Eumeta japonica]|uniref:Secreted protein n=1 Tax=Eumeta variegata TaxID=151549 RepID=A0A4C1Y2L8_EUMVA|nr:hypothetical protein EVAR_83522_1 [Eumeta japonica]
MTPFVVFGLYLNLCCAQAHVVDVKEIPKTLLHGFHARWNSSTKNSTDLRLGVRALLIIVRLIVDKKTVQRRWFRTVELFDKERHRLELGCSGAGFRTVELFDEERHRLETGVRALIIARLIVDKKTAVALVSRTVELFDEERYRLETWRNGAAHHRSTDCGRVDAPVLHRLV